MGCGAERGGAKVMLQHAQRQSRLRLQCCHGAQHPPRASRARLRSAGVLQRSEPRSRCCTGASGSAARVSRKPWTACASEAAGPQQPRLPGAHNKQLTLLQRSSGINWVFLCWGVAPAGEAADKQCVAGAGGRAAAKMQAAQAPWGQKLVAAGELHARAAAPGASLPRAGLQRRGNSGCATPREAHRHGRRWQKGRWGPSARARTPPPGQKRSTLVSAHALE